MFFFPSSVLLHTDKQGVKQHSADYPCSLFYDLHVESYNKLG